MPAASIRNRLFFYYSIALVALLAVSGFAVVQISAMERLTSALDHRWIVGTRTLGEMADLLSEVRLAETRLALATTTEAVAAASAAAQEHIADLAEERSIYDGLEKTADEVSFLATFDQSWKDWHAEHDAWVALPESVRASRSPGFQLHAQAFYRSTDDAVDALIELNTAGADAAGERARGIVMSARQIFLLAVFGALAFAGWLAVVIRSQISRPLIAITSALSSLAAGDRDVVIPESDRKDEIGRLAKSFEVFRVNAFALEEAHRVAEAAQQRATALARHDSLTGLVNRRVLIEELEKARTKADRAASSFAVLLLDLDSFKPVNDVYGHSAGDVVLAEIANRLKAIVRKDDTLARLGGDEFAIITELSAGDQTEGPIKLADRLLEIVREPIVFDDRKVEVGVSIGIAILPADADEAETVLRAADIAMYRAKAAGRGLFRFYEASMDEELRVRAKLENAVRHAVAQQEIEPHYQPLVALEDGRLLGFEILSRWTDPETGVVPPDQFIPIIEHLGLMSEFTRNILKRACLDAKAWPAHLTLSLNVSPSELKDALLPTRLLAVLSETGFSPNRLELEITENALVGDLDVARSILTSIQALGIRIALDDFGTGYSSLYHLRELRWDRLKIDRSFVQAMNSDGESAKIVDAILSLARSLHLPATAEGIEDPAVIETLGAGGADIGQGFLFGKAMSATKTAAWINLHEVDAPAPVAARKA